MTIVSRDEIGIQPYQTQLYDKMGKMKLKLKWRARDSEYEGEESNYQSMNTR